MDIPNLSQNSSTPSFINTPSSPKKNPVIGFSIVLVLAIGAGFLFSRLLPTSQSGGSIMDTITYGDITSADKVKSSSDIVVGQSYGDTGKSFTDTATGIIRSGGVNGEGTHTLEREGGKTQNAAITSSTIDLDLFVGHKVEIKGETNSSKKAGWFLDVGIVKVLE